MKNIISVFMLLVVGAFSTQLVASEVRVSNSISLSAEEANKSVFHIKSPKDSTVTVSLAGNDKFISSSYGAGESIKFQDKTAFIRVGSPSRTSVGLATECGVGISIVIETFDSEVDVKEILPKVHIVSSGNCKG